MIAIIVISEKGRKIAEALSIQLSTETRIYSAQSGSLKGLTAEVFDRQKFEGIVFIMALGIVVRVISSRLKNKYCDPAVVAIDEGERFAVSVVSGHEGGANKLAVEVGNILGAEPVITTGSEAGKNLIIGVGCRRGIKKDEIMKAVEYALKKTKSPAKSLRYIATIDLKKAEEGLRDAARQLGVPLRIVSSSLISKFSGKYQRSAFVKEKIGVEGVSEPCALIAARNPRLILPKTKVGRVTVAVAREG